MAMYPPPSKLEEYPPTMGIPMAPPAMQQPTSGIPVAPQRWSSGLCDCTQDVANCCITCWCPCITFGQIAEIVDKGSPSCGASGALYALILCLSVSLFGTGCQWIYSCAYRSKIRAIYSLPEEPCNDCILHFCCECCSLCQLHRELKHLGFDMAIGWHANMEKQAYAATQPPVVPEGMMR